MTDFSKTFTKLKKLKQFIERDLGEIIGTEAVNHYTENFEKQSFHGKPWKEVKRRDASSSWYGFKYGSKQKLPSKHPRRQGVKSKYKKRKDSPMTNFAKSATKTPILSSQDSELENSIQYIIKGNSVIVFSDKPYAKVHNEGGRVKVFGKKTVKMPKRQFIGKSKVLEMLIKRKVNARINQILS